MLLLQRYKVVLCSSLARLPKLIYGIINTKILLAQSQALRGDISI